MEHKKTFTLQMLLKISVTVVGLCLNPLLFTHVALTHNSYQYIGGKLSLVSHSKIIICILNKGFICNILCIKVKGTCCKSVSEFVSFLFRFIVFLLDDSSVVFTGPVLLITVSSPTLCTCSLQSDWRSKGLK